MKLTGNVKLPSDWDFEKSIKGQLFAKRFMSPELFTTNMNIAITANIIHRRIRFNASTSYLLFSRPASSLPIQSSPS
jgi:hypothetical protein